MTLGDFVKRYANFYFHIPPLVLLGSRNSPASNRNSCLERALKPIWATTTNDSRSKLCSKACGAVSTPRPQRICGGEQHPSAPPRYPRRRRLNQGRASETAICGAWGRSAPKRMTSLSLQRQKRYKLSTGCICAGTQVLICTLSYPAYATSKTTKTRCRWFRNSQAALVTKGKQNCRNSLSYDSSTSCADVEAISDELL